MNVDRLRRLAESKMQQLGTVRRPEDDLADVVDEMLTVGEGKCRVERPQFRTEDSSGVAGLVPNMDDVFIHFPYGFDVKQNDFVQVDNGFTYHVQRVFDDQMIQYDRTVYAQRKEQVG